MTMIMTVAVAAMPWRLRSRGGQLCKAASAFMSTDDLWHADGLAKLTDGAADAPPRVLVAALGNQPGGVHRQPGGAVFDGQRCWSQAWCGRGSSASSSASGGSRPPARQLALPDLVRKLHGRQAKGASLAGACLSGDHDIAASEQQRDGLVLHIGRQAARRRNDIQHTRFSFGAAPRTARRGWRWAVLEPAAGKLENSQPACSLRCLNQLRQEPQVWKSTRHSHGSA